MADSDYCGAACQDAGTTAGKLDILKGGAVPLDRAGRPRPACPLKPQGFDQLQVRGLEHRKVTQKHGQSQSQPLANDAERQVLDTT